MRAHGESPDNPLPGDSPGIPPAPPSHNGTSLPVLLSMSLISPPEALFPSAP